MDGHRGDTVLERSSRCRVGEIEESLQRLADLTTKLLQLSRAEATVGPRHERQNLTPALQAAMEDFTRRVRGPLTIEFEDRLYQDLMVQMDADAFGVAFRNLIENAGKHGPAGTPIRVVVANDWTISVANAGPVVPPQILATLKERYRRGQTDIKGPGLGLAIVERIVAQSGGHLSLCSPARGQPDGFEAVMTLP